MKEAVRQLLEVYAKAPVLLDQKLKSIPEQQLHWKPSREKWNIKEIVIHICDAEVNAFIRYRAIIAESGIAAFVVDESKWADLLQYDNQDMEDYIALFRIIRKITYKQLLLVDERVWTNNYVTHSYLGKITLERWLQLYVDHFDQHMKQIDRNLTLFNR